MNRHSGPVEPVSDRSVRAGLSAQVCQLQPFQSRSIFFFIDRSLPSLLAAWRANFFNPVASCRARSIFFLLLTGHFLCWARRLFFFCLLPLSSVSARHFFYLFCPVASPQPCQRARIFLFGGCPVASCCPHRIFFLWCPVSSCCACRIFFSVWSLLQSVWAPCCRLIFFLLTAMQACQGRQRFFFLCPVASGQQQLRTQIFFGHSHTLLPCAQLFVFVSSRCLPF